MQSFSIFSHRGLLNQLCRKILKSGLFSPCCCGRGIITKFGGSEMKFKALFGLLAAGLMATSAAKATELEVTHWWTSGGEAAAVAEFAKAFDASGDKWIDACDCWIWWNSQTIMVSRITGGIRLVQFQFNHGRQAEDLIEAGFCWISRRLQKLRAGKMWLIHRSLLDACTVDGRIYCTPVNIHSLAMALAVS